MAAALGLVVTKKFNYRGDAEETWSNKYWLSGLPPVTSVDWDAFFHAFTDQEKNILGVATEIVAGYGYDRDDQGAHSVWSIDLEALGQTKTGTIPLTASNKMAGDQAACLEWRTNRKNTRGKWVYLRKYYHGGPTLDLDADYIADEWKAALENWGTGLMDGTVAAGRIIRSQSQVEDLALTNVVPYTTTRTLKRRGKRPS